MNTLRMAVLGAIVAFLAAGCSSTNLEQKPAPAPAPEAKPAAPPAAPPPAPAPVRQVEAPAPTPMDPLMDPNGILSHRSVFFDFDESVLHDTDVPVIQAHATYLVDHGQRTVRIEGNCDERGGSEYNLALGQRRANAVRGRMTLLGVASDRIETVSFGKEKPRNPGHDEAAWAENRRADLVYK
jgi:peptidoglycan-associated lipoprotein